MIVSPVTGGPTSSADIQALIDSKVALLGQIIAILTEITASPKPNYTIDGQSLDWVGYLNGLTAAQKTETDCLKQLYAVQNTVFPYQLQSTGTGRY